MDRLGTHGNATPRPAWGWLYVSAALALAPFVLVAALVPEGAGRIALEIVAALILSGVLALWVRVNRIGIELQGRRDGGWRQASIIAAAAAPSPDPRHPDPSQHPGWSRDHRLAGRDLHHGTWVAVPPWLGFGVHR